MPNDIPPSVHELLEHVWYCGNRQRTDQIALLHSVGVRELRRYAEEFADEVHYAKLHGLIQYIGTWHDPEGDGPYGCRWFGYDYPEYSLTMEGEVALAEYRLGHDPGTPEPPPAAAETPDDTAAAEIERMTIEALKDAGHPMKGDDIARAIGRDGRDGQTGTVWSNMVKRGVLKSTRQGYILQES